MLKNLLHYITGGSDSQDRFMNKDAYTLYLERVQIESAARFARGGVAMQESDIQTEEEFAEEMMDIERLAMSA